MYAGPHTFQQLYGLDSGEDVGEIKLRAYFGNVEISDLDFAEMHSSLWRLWMSFWGPPRY